MAEKDKVPVVAIRLIIQMRHDEYHNHSYRAIAENIKDEFGIEVTPQAIGYLYRKHKDKYSDKDLNNSSNHHQENSKTETTKIPVSKPKKTVATLSKPLFERDEEVDLKNLFDKAE